MTDVTQSFKLNTYHLLITTRCDIIPHLNAIFLWVQMKNVKIKTPQIAQYREFEIVYKHRDAKNLFDFDESKLHAEALIVLKGSIKLLFYRCFQRI
jgi:hypothetical protein